MESPNSISLRSNLIGRSARIKMFNLWQINALTVHTYISLIQHKELPLRCLMIVIVDPVLLELNIPPNPQISRFFEETGVVQLVTTLVSLQKLRGSSSWFLDAEQGFFCRRLRGLNFAWSKRRRNGGMGDRFELLDCCNWDLYPKVEYQVPTSISNVEARRPGSGHPLVFQYNSHLSDRGFDGRSRKSRDLPRPWRVFWRQQTSLLKLSHKLQPQNLEKMTTSSTSAKPQGFCSPSKLRDSLDRDGFVVIPSFYSPAEIDRLRSACSIAIDLWALTRNLKRD